MKYNITINQPLMIEYDLNIPQWCILDILSVAPTWCEPVIADGIVYYWVARQKIADELLALDLKPDTIYRYIKNLSDLGFLEHIKQGKKDLIRLTKKGKSIFVTMSEKNPNHYVGKKSENNSEKNPTYNNTNFYNYTKDKDSPKNKFSDDTPQIQISKKLLSYLQEIHNTIKKPNMQKWAIEVDKMIRIDKREPEKILKLLRYVFEPNGYDGTFWRSNIKSTRKLREQYDTIAIQINNELKKGK